MVRKNKYMKINQLRIGIVLSYLSMGLGIIVSIIYTPIMLRLLGQSEYGLYSLVASVVAYLGILNLGFSSAYMRYFSIYNARKNEDEVAKINGMFLLIFSVLGIVALITGMLLSNNTELIFGTELSKDELHKSKILMIILVVNLAISFFCMIFSSYITANEKFLFQKLIQLIRIVVNPFVVLPILVLGYGSVGMVLATTVLSLIIEIANILFCIKKLKIKFIFRNFDFILMKDMTIFSSYVFLGMIVDQINWNVDKFIVGRFHGTTSVAIYGLASQLLTYYMGISTAISTILTPRVHILTAKYENPEKELSDLFIKVGRLQFIILSLILVTFIFFGKPFIYFWAGKEYTSSYFITLLLLVPSTIPFIQNIGIQIQMAKNLHKFRSLVYFLIAILNFIISIPLAKIYGGIGAAIGTALSFIVGNFFIMNWYYYKKMSIDIKQFWKEIIRISYVYFPMTIIGIIIIRTVDLYNFKLFIYSGFMYVAVSIVLIYLIGLNKYEKNLIGKPINKIFRKFISNN